MKKLLLNIILLLVCFEVAARSLADSARVWRLIDDVQKKYAADKRTTYYKVNIESFEPLSLKVESSDPKAIEGLKLHLEKQSIKAKIRESLLPAEELDGKTWGIATLSVCNNRVAPDNAAEMATQLLLGTPVQVLKKERGYYLVRTPDNYLSWTDDAGIATFTPQEFKKWQLAEKIVVLTSYGHALSRPAKHSSPVSDVVAGNILNISGKEKKFYKVLFPDGRKGYIPLKDAMAYKSWVSRANPQAEQVLETARSLMGVPYLWGGTSSKGVDCSGFTKTSYFLNGIILPRDASQQVLYGQQVDIFENDSVSITKALRTLKAGDLLFFAAGKNRVPNARVTHTAIYIGDGKFIQSASMVRVNSLVASSSDYDSFQSRTLVNAKRMLTAIGSPGISRIEDHPFYSPNKH
ncbi:C40 family peptidase [Desertivirga brevis]|uniref:C40 family peptidase n=1 Tax=Desertivirga brevis TaxID=2810310 RepID=UPI001A9620AE